MKSKFDNMKHIFDSLSEGNKDIVILIAKSVKVGQDEAIQSSHTNNQSA